MLRSIPYILLLFIAVMAVLPASGQKNKKDPTIADVRKILDTKAIRTRTNEIIVRMVEELEESAKWASVIDEQRGLAFEGADGLIRSSTDPMGELIDHAFWKGMQLLMVAVVLFVLVYFVIHRIRMK